MFHTGSRSVGMLKDGGPSHQHVGSGRHSDCGGGRVNRGSQLYSAVAQFFRAHGSVA
jgi:hypothetical protein